MSPPPQNRPAPAANETKPSHRISSVVFSKYSGRNRSEGRFPRTDPRYWRDRLILRRYRFPASGTAARDFVALIDHAGTGYFFPLGTPDVTAAAARACRIYQTALEQGWNAVCRQFSRELTVSFEWCMNPVLWTYTTIHTLLDDEPEPVFDALPANPNRQRVLVAETDAGIRRALCWSINHQAGFVSVPCDSAAALRGVLEARKPRMVLLNRKLAGPIGFKRPGMVSSILPGVPALTYSIYVDGDQMVVSTAGGARGYLIKRVPPDRLLEPILKISRPSELMTEDLLVRVKYYFQELLQLHPSHDPAATGKLTPREREVMGLLSKGCADKEIAQAMGVSVWTVHAHIKHIFERFQVRTRTEAVVRYLEK